MSAYYTDLAAAFVRGSRPDAPDLPPDRLAAWGREQGLKLHKFKRTDVLPRVQRVLGFLQATWPASLVDVGSGRGAFLWPLLDHFPDLDVTSVELHPVRVRDLRAVAAGGVSRLTVVEQDAQALALPDESADVVTLLEVLEHMPRPQDAMRHALRIARRHVAITVPSREDDNPEHIHLFTRDTLTEMLKAAGAQKVQVEYVLNHIVAFAR